MSKLGKSLVFHFKYWNEMNQLYWKQGTLEGLDDVEETIAMARAVGDESKRDAAALLESCGEAIEQHFSLLVKCQRGNTKGAAEKKWTLFYNLYLKVKMGEPKLRAGITIPQSEQAVIIPWLWCKGKSAAEEKMVEYLKEKVKVRGQDLLLPAGTVALDQIPILEQAQGFDVNAGDLIERVRRAFSTITKADCEYLFTVPKNV